MNSSQDILDKKWYYTRGRKCVIIHKCIMEHEHNGLSWASTLALMVKHLSEANENKDRQINKILQYTVMPLYGDKQHGNNDL